MPFGIGPAEIIVVLIIVLLVFGPKRLPDLGRSLGRGMREFKDSVTGNDGGDLPAGSDERPSSSEPAHPERRDAPAQPAGTAGERDT
jgi:sec-independent protein translocase protein TatA